MDKPFKLAGIFVIFVLMPVFAVCENGDQDTPENTVKKLNAAYKNSDAKSAIECWSDNYVAKEMEAARKWIGEMDNDECLENYNTEKKELLGMANRKLAAKLMGNKLKTIHEYDAVEKMQWEVMSVDMGDNKAIVTMKNEKVCDKFLFVKENGKWFIERKADNVEVEKSDDKNQAVSDGPGNTPEETVGNMIKALKGAKAEAFVNCISGVMIKKKADEERKRLARMTGEMIEKKFGRPLVELNKMDDRELLICLTKIQFKNDEILKDIFISDKLKFELVSTEIEGDKATVYFKINQIKEEKNEVDYKKIKLVEVDGKWYINGEIEDQ